jgi:hypothetical protein
MERRLKLRHGDLPNQEERMAVDFSAPESYNCVTRLNLLTMEYFLPHLKFPQNADGSNAKDADKR